MNGNGFGVKRPAAKLFRAVQILFIIFAQLFSALQVPAPVFAAGGAYSLKWYAADPAVNSGPYLPTYVKRPPSQVACPTPSGGVGRAADPMKDAVAYGSAFTSNQLDAVTSLAPKNLALGQIVPFEMEISVSGSTTPENGVIQFTSGFNTHTTSGDDFGYDPAYMIYCAFVDTADKGTIDPGSNAKVDSWTSTLANPGGGSKEEIQGTFQISGLNNGDNIIVEIWVVLKPTIPPSASGNVQTGLAEAHTAATPADAISTGNQTVPLLRVHEFYSSNADVSITKSDSPDPVVLGNQLTYTIVATNNSIDTIANGVVVTDNLDPNTTFVSGTWPGGACSATAGVVTCNVGALAQASSVTITLVVTVKTTAPTAGTVQTGTCTVGAPGVDLCNIATVAAITADSNTTNNSASAPTDVIGTPTLSLTKTASPATYSAVGQTINYTYVLKNTGNVTLSSPFAVTDDKATVTCPAAVTSLAPNATLDCTASYIIAQADLDAGSVTNKATATASFNGNTVTSNQATATVTAVKSPALLLTKSATPSTYDTVGQTITYSYVIKNTGNVTLSGPFSVTDDKATVTCTQPADGALSPNETMSCTASYTITQTDLDASKVTNKATATNGTVTSNEATATVNAIAHPNLSLVKTATPATYSKVGDVVSYSYEVKNIGNVALVGPYAVTDDKASVTCPQPASLAVGASITCTASYTITQADLDAGSVTNKATATAVFGGNPVTSNQAQATVNAVQTRALTLDKTAQETTYAKVGEVLHYSYLVTNSGNVTLHDAITVSDNRTTATCPALPAGGLIPGASITCTASYAVSQADLDAGSVTNIASATSGTTTSNTDTVTVPATQTPALSLTKSASPATYTSAGQSISYSYVLKNTGNVTLSSPFAVTDDKASVTCPTVTSLAVGDTLTCGASHTVTQAEVDAGSITNHATATATFGGSTVTSNEATATVTATQTPALLLTKSASPSTYDTVGQIIGYSYVLTNTGNVTLTGPITVSDDKATVTCPALDVAGLKPGASITCSATYAITQADLDAGFVKNTAMGHASFGGSPVNSNEASATVNALQQGGLGLTKTATPPTYSKVGDVVSYSYGVKNTGNVTLAGPFTVNDDIVGAVSCPAGSLAPQATVTCTATYTITQANLDAGSLTNHATATDGTLTSNQAQATVTAVQNRALVIDKTAQEATYAKAGDVIHYSYVVTNSGNVTLHDPIVVSDDKAADESCPALPDSGLAPGASITCTASYTITQADLDAGSVTNVASAASGTTTSPTDTVTVPATQSPALTLKKSATPLTYTTVGQTITYDYLLTNSGNVTLISPFEVSDDKALVTCPAAVTSLAPGATLNCTATYTISQADLDGGKVTNLATATAKFGDTTVTSNQDTATVTAVQSPALSLVKTATPPTYDAVGQTISYSYVVTNTGNVTLTNAITVSDDKATVSCPALDVAGLKPGVSITCSASYVITQLDLDNGSVTNTAIGHGSFGGNPVDSNPDSETVNAVQAPALSLVKSADPLTYDHVGQSIAYSYVLKNIGNVTLAGPFTVSDDKATVTCPADATLAVNASITCGATYAITQADLDAGFVTNTATGHAQTLGGTPVNSNNASATVTAVQNRALAIDKTAQETTYAKAGDVIHYSYVVTNSGNVTLHDAIVVSDDKTTATCPDLPSGGLAPGASITCTATYTITQADLDLGSLTNVASAASGNTVSPTDTVTVPATQTPKLTIDKTVTEPSYAHVGEVLHYGYKVTNSGNVTLYNITVIDDKAIVTCEDTSGGLAPAAFITCTASYTITQADIDAGAVTNSAYAKSGDTQSPPDTVTVEAVKQPSLSLSKVATPHFSDPVKVGDTIDYTLTATNTGNLTLTNVSISDVKLGTLACTPNQPATLAPTGTLVCTGTYAITQADINAGKVNNTGIATSDQTPPTETPNEVPVPQAPALTIDKTATPSTYSKVGDVISYSYLVTNSGNVTLTNAITVSDDKATVSCPALDIAGLKPGASITCTASYTITQADLDAGSVVNSAYARSGDTQSPPDTVTVPATQTPAISLTKVATPHFSDPVKIGDTIDYTLTATNTGNITLTNVTITDAKLGTLSCTPDQPATLAPTETLVCKGTYAITQQDIDAGKVKNTGIAKSDQTPPTETPNEVPVPKAPALVLDKSATPHFSSPVQVGDKIDYTLTATNTGNVTLTNVSISDGLLPTLDCTPAQPATLAPAGTLVCTGTYTITQADINAGKVNNLGIAKSDQTPPTETPKEVPVPKAPAISLAKTADPTTYNAVGQTITYSYMITNTGNVTLPGPFTVSDDKATVTCDAAPAGGLAPLATLNCAATYTISQPDLDAGSVTNTATASTSYDGSNVTSEPATATVTADQAPALALTKSATPHFGNPPKAGETIDYTLTASNTGNITLTNVTITDALLPSLNCTPAQPAILAPAGTLVCTGTYAITQADIDAGKVDNTGIAKSNQTPPTETPNEVPVPKAPALTIDKTAAETTYAHVDDVLHYSYLVTNSGNVTLYNISVTDDKAAVTCPDTAAGLAPLSTITCTASYTIAQADIDAGKVINSAYAKSGDTQSPPDEVTVPATQTPALTIDKTASPMTYSKVGDVIAYSYLVTNSGNVTLTNAITVTDNKATVTCPALDVAGLKPGASITCTASYTIAQSDLDAGSVVNSAYATSGTTKSNTDTETVTAVQTPALSLTKTASPTTYSAVGQTISYSYVITNTGNVTLAGPFTISDDKATVTCPATSSLTPAAFITCTASYTIKQSDLDAGSVTNKATATNGTVTSNEASQTVNAVQSPAITLTKTATPTYYSKVGDVIQYTLVAKNTGNVTLKDVSISDPKLGALTCTLTQPAILEPNATLTCTGSYTIQASDLIAGQVNKVTNTATVNATGPAGQPVSATASATVYQQTGALLPTQTTCQMYAAGPSAWPAMYSSFNYQVKSNKINSVSPGVIFYYNTITAPSASFTLNVVEKNSLAWKPMLIQDLGQAVLYTSDCSKASGVTVTTQTTGSTYTVTFTVTGATPGATYYMGIKYSPQNLVGQAVKAVNKVYPTSTYSFETTGQTGSATSIDVKPK